MDRWITALELREDEKPQSHARLIRLAGIVGMVANALFAELKLLIGLLSHSVSIVSDAVNNLIDALSSVITLVGLSLSNRTPNRKHPLGFGRIEYISGLIIATLVVITGGTFLKTSIERIITPEPVSFTTVQLVVLGATVLGKWLLARFLTAIGRHTDSASLIATGADSRMDVLVSSLTIAGALITRFFGLLLDGYIGVVLALFILYTGFDQIRDTIGRIIGERPGKALAEQIKAEVLQHEPIVGAYDLIIHNYGPSTRFGSLNLEIPDFITVEKAYEAMNAAQAAIFHKHGIYFTFGLYAVNTYDDDIIKMRAAVLDIINKTPGALSLHAFYYDKAKYIIRFDVIVDFSIRDYEAMREVLAKQIHQLDSQADISINIDPDYA